VADLLVRAAQTFVIVFAIAMIITLRHRGRQRGRIAQPRRRAVVSLLDITPRFRLNHHPSRSHIPLR
jgi:hypothetical protein